MRLDGEDFCEPGDWYAAHYESPLYPYQLEFATAAERLIDDCRNLRLPSQTAIFMVSRQGGKNETSARLEARLLLSYATDTGNCNLIKSAPTFRPSLVNSITRLEQCLKASPFMTRRGGRADKRWQRLQQSKLKPAWRKVLGYIYQLGNASVTMLSGDPDAERVGGTAGLGLEVDECQKFDERVYRMELRPMLATTNAPALLYGTSWTNDNLLEREREKARELQRKLGRQLLFEYPWHVVAEQNPHYATFAQNELDELGAGHPIWESMFELKPISRLSKLFTDDHLAAMHGRHPRRSKPTLEREVYVAGVDLCGEDEQDPNKLEEEPKHDSTVVTVAKLLRRETRDGRLLPVLHVVAHLWLPGLHPESSVDEISTLLFQTWKVRRVVVDASGVGRSVARRLAARAPSRVEPLKSTLDDVTEMGFGLIAAAKTGRLKIYCEADEDTAEQTKALREFWFQCKHCDKILLPNQKMRFSAPTKRVGGKVVHDDFVKSLGYCLEAATQHLYSYSNPENRGSKSSTWEWGHGVG